MSKPKFIHTLSREVAKGILSNLSYADIKALAKKCAVGYQRSKAGYVEVLSWPENLTCIPLPYDGANMSVGVQLRVGINGTLLSESCRVGGIIAHQRLNQSPWVGLINSDKWPENMGSALKGGSK